MKTKVGDGRPAKCVPAAGTDGYSSCGIDDSFVGQSCLIHTRVAMPADLDLPRRGLVFCAAGLTAGMLTAGLAGCGGPSAADRQLSFTTLAAAEAEVMRLAQAAERVSAASWNWARRPWCTAPRASSSR